MSKPAELPIHKQLVFSEERLFQKKGENSAVIICDCHCHRMSLIVTLALERVELSITDPWIMHKGSQVAAPCHPESSISHNQAGPLLFVLSQHPLSSEDKRPPPGPNQH